MSENGLLYRYVIDGGQHPVGQQHRAAGPDRAAREYPGRGLHPGPQPLPDQPHHLKQSGRGNSGSVI